MAARADELSMMKPAHAYHAEANLLTAELEHPLKEHIKPHARVKLPSDGRYQSKHAEPFRFEGILSYRSGYTQVAGHPSSKLDGFTTLTTSVVEGLNVLDVVTADRVVAQISTVHPVYGEGQVPSVTFLGTRFENLRIGGRKIEVEENLEMLGTRSDESYFDNRDLIERLSRQYREVSKDGLPDWTRKQYPKDRAIVQDIGEGRRQMECSLVNGVSKAPGTSFGHVIDLPHFGKIFLGELKVMHEPTKDPNVENDKYRFQLTMIRLEMGCIATGTSHIVMADSNGTGKGG
jgi:hypothetical protein